MRQPTSPVTPEDADKFDAYVRKWQDFLNLKDWRIIRSHKRTRGAMAEISKRDVEARMVTYKIGVDFGVEGVSEYTLESTAVHELLHILLAELIETSKIENISHEVLMAAEHRVVHTIERLLVPQPKDE